MTHIAMLTCFIGAALCFIPDAIKFVVAVCVGYQELQR